jgi:penicillin-binding protein 1A
MNLLKRPWLLAGVVLLVLALAPVVVVLGAAVAGLPDTRQIADYRPAISSRLYASDGQLMAEFAREQRTFAAIDTIPDHVVAAFMAAEDKDFYRHGGVDWSGVGRAMLANVSNVADGRRLEGASTITQQVAENILLDNETGRGNAFERVVMKVREIVLAMRLEQALSKDRIMELYLNEIFLGRRAYGVQAASWNYFGKPMDQLTIAEAAYFGALPKAPNNYNPVRFPERAIERRNWVLSRMAANGYITQAEARAAQAETLVVRERGRQLLYSEAGEVVEEVRRTIEAAYGEDAAYTRGFLIRTTVDPRLQGAAREALRAHLESLDRPRGWRGPLGNIGPGDGWVKRLADQKLVADDPDWRAAVVVRKDGVGVRLGFTDGQTAMLGGDSTAWAARGKGLQPGDVVFAGRTESGAWRLEQFPQINGGFAAINVHTGRVLAMVGGYSWRQSAFNRATQAERQPGSAIKPIIYAAALERGFTPDSTFSDARLRMGRWSPDNADGRFFGMMTLTNAIALSRNTVSVRVAQRTGIRRVVDLARTLDVYGDVRPDLTMALGSYETTVMKLTGALAAMANGGRYIPPTLIDRIQDLDGKTVWRHDARRCTSCAGPFSNLSPPDVPRFGRQVMSETTAYGMVEMLRVAVTNGTGRAAQPKDGHIVIGKTGTTNDYRDAWFVGASPHIAAGVYVGFDTPRTMGRGATGGGYAAPVFRAFMEEALKDTPVEEQFVVPIEVRDLKDRESRLEARIRGATAHLVAKERAEAAAREAEAAQVADAGASRAGRQDTATVSFDSGAAPANAPAQKTAEPSLDGVY